MRRARIRSVWITAVFAVITIVSIACGSSDSPTPVPTSAPTPESTATPIPSPTPAPAVEARAPSREEYAAAVRALSERADARGEEIFEPLERAASPVEFLRAMSLALPQVIEAVQEDITAFEALDAPDDYGADHRRILAYLRDQLVLLGRQLETVRAEDELRFRELSVEEETLQRNLVSDLSQSFREFFLTTEAARVAGEVFGGLTDEESAYLDTLVLGFEEFGKRVAVFGQALSRQFADERAMLKALADAGAGTAFEAVHQVIEPVTPPARFEAAHELLLEYLEGVVRIDRVIGQAARDGDAVQFAVSNLELATAETSVRAVLNLPPQISEIAFRGAEFAFRQPEPEVLDGGYREALYSSLREFRPRFLQTGPDYLAFNIRATHMAEIVSQVSPGFIALLEETRSNVAALSPPDELRDDHQRLIEYFDDTLAAQRAISTAAAAEDLAGVRAGMDLTLESFCDTAKDLSDAIKPVVSVQFGGPPGTPLPPMCGPPGG